MKKGDHLVSPRTGYDHHGLYLGNGEVIHYTGDGSAFSKGEITITSLEEFCNDENVAVEEHFHRKHGRKKSVKRALKRLGEDSYNVVFNNCEHFVNWCIDGKRSSSQVNNVVITSSIATGLAGVATKTLEKEAIQTVASNVARSLASTSTGIGSGLITAATTSASSSATPLVASFIAAPTASVLAPAVAPIAVAIGVGYATKKLWDEFFW